MREQKKTPKVSKGKAEVLSEEEGSQIASSRKERIWALFDEKRKEFDEGEGPHFSSINYLHKKMNEAEWLAENTSFPFRTVYHSPIPGLANLGVRYLCKMARAGNEGAIRHLGYTAVEIVETLEAILAEESEEANRAAELVSSTAEDLPYWPMLQFLHTAANNQFPRIADKIGLGSRCPINVSDAANYSLHTPINRYVWGVLIQFQSARQIASWGLKKGEPVKTAYQSYNCTEDQRAIFIRCHSLPLLTKTTAQQWAEQAIMPFIKLTEPDLSKVRAFKNIDTGSKGQKFAPLRKVVIRALVSMAPKMAKG